MPYSNELGMRVYDRNEGVQQGELAGQIFGSSLQRGFQNARELYLDERKLKMMDDEVKAKATALQQHQLGLEEMKDLVANGVPFEKALFQTAPKVFYGNPQGFAQTVQRQAAENAKEAARKTAFDALQLHRKSEEERLSMSPERRKAGEQVDLLYKVAPGVMDPNRRDAAILGVMQRGEDIKAKKEQRLEQTASIPKLDEATKGEISNINKEIERIQKAHDLLPPSEGQFEITKSKDGTVSGKPGQLTNQLKRMRFNAQIAGLKEQRRVLAGQKSAVTEIAPAENAPDPSQQGEALKLGTKIKQGDKTYVYQGGDVNDPKSYVEAK